MPCLVGPVLHARPLVLAWYDGSVSPGGHLITTMAACAASATLTGSWPLTAGIPVGGFLIDVDPALDYLLVERQRALRPRALLPYSLEGRLRPALPVLPSYRPFRRPR